MTTEPQAQTSERERFLFESCEYMDVIKAPVTERELRLSAIASEAIGMLRADAEKIRALEAGRIEAQHVAQHLSLWRGRVATSRTWDRGEEVDLLGALLDKLDAAIAATQSPRSEAGEDVK